MENLAAGKKATRRRGEGKVSLREGAKRRAEEGEERKEGTNSGCREGKVLRIGLVPYWLEKGRVGGSRGV